MSAEKQVIRRAMQSDLVSLHPVIERAFRGETARNSWSHDGPLAIGERITKSELIDILGRPDCCLIGAFIDGNPIGCVKVRDLGDGICELGLLTVDPVLQAGGLGKALLAAAEELAAEEFAATRLEACVVVQRPKLFAYYRRRGYQDTGATKPYPVPLDPPLHFAVLAKTVGRRG